MIPTWHDDENEINNMAGGAQREVEPPPPFRVTDEGLVIREDFMASAVWAVNREPGPHSQALAVLEAVFGKVTVVKDSLRG